ncbi:MAG: uroporphyrinogen-III synthase [Rothia sp. (in: high G+C Gram-positive bacteria)]|uniref:uroporphyrinogen-III synthase n=1 Tax=Rothia sp. (in: high G+C Gram-positive bacteria) TaxID=1885016 RepID=UPI0026E0F166|nr:uroporphyrinogen-III synthase [Rothia sp. (in: high G+C Gram-positive bacteria)]MDO5751077.1 uroporphyrinogen-III synthase [Rothia sp. (in: high G+C Gram-positive bacteria)]
MTRTRAKAAEFIEELQQRMPGMHIDCAPIFEPEYLPFSLPNDLAEYAYITVTSANTVHALTNSQVNRIRAAGAPIACVGGATAKALTKRDLTVVFTPSRADASTMLAELPDSPAGSTDKVLVLEGATARPTLREGLAAKGYTVTVEKTYSMRPVPAEHLHAGECSLEYAQQHLQSYDCVVATAPSLLTALALSPEYLHAQQHPHDIPPLEAIASGLAIQDPQAYVNGTFPQNLVAIGRSTAARAELMELTHSVSATPSASDLAAAVLALLDPKQSRE